MTTLIFSLILLCAATPYIYGQQYTSPDSVSTHYLETVVVRAPREPDYKRGVIPAQQLSGQELKALSAFSIADALRSFSGVQVKDFGGVGGLKTVNIRSMGTHHVGIFYDGVELSNAQNGQIDLGQYSLDNMEAIQVFNGQKGSYLQPAKDFGSSGTVYLQTRKPTFTDGAQTNLRASLRTGSFDLFNPAILIEHRLEPRVTMSFNAEWIKSSGKYKFRYQKVNPLTHEIAYDTTAVRHNGDINATRLEGNLHIGLPDGQMLVKVYNYNSERGIPGAIVNNVWRRGERLWDNNSFVQTTYEQQLHDRIRLHAIAKYAYYQTHFVRNEATAAFKVDNLYQQQELYGSVASAFQLIDHWYLSAAYDLQWNKLDADLYDFVYPHRFTHLLALASTYTNDWINAQASLLGTLAQDKAQKLTKAPLFRKLTPAAILSIKPWQTVDLRFNAFYKQSFRLPTFNDLYYTEIGNIKLDPEHTTQYNLGLQYQFTPQRPWLYTLDFKVDAYYNLVTNKIIAYPKGQQFRWTMINLGKVDIRGIDAQCTWSLVPVRDLQLSLRTQYTYQRAIDITNPKDSYYRHQIPYIPWHSGSATAIVQYKGWQLNYNFIYAGERYSQLENFLENHLQPWYTNDLALAYERTLRGYGLRLQLECNNLLSQAYDVIANYPMPLRNYRLTLVVTH